MKTEHKINPVEFEKHSVKMEDYPIFLAPIPKDEGGGFLVSFPDLPGCIADGDSIEEALLEAKDAFKAWIQVEYKDKEKLPIPKSYSG